MLKVYRGDDYHIHESYMMTLFDDSIVWYSEVSIVWGDDYDYLGEDTDNGYAIAVPLSLNCGSLEEYADMLWGDPSADPYPEELYFANSFKPWLKRIANIHNWSTEQLLGGHR